MVRIPRTEASVAVQMANQPTMSPDALTGPGRALQGLGRAISGLSGAFEAMNEPSDTDKLTAQLALLDASNNAEKYYTERLSSFTPDTDPDAWHQDTRAGINSIFTDAERRVPGYPKLVDQYRVRSHAFVGDYDVKAHKYATGVKTERYATSAFNSLRSSLESADPTTPEGIALIDTIDKQLVRIPGLNVEQARSQIADDMVKRFEAEAAADPIAAMEKVEAIKKWREQLQIAPPQPQQGQGVGPQSSLQMRDFTAGRNFRPLPAQNVKNIVLHDVSGPSGSRRLPKGGNIPHYHITFDDKGVYNEIALDRRAPHAVAFNRNSIGIAHIGYEGDKLSPAAIANGAKAVKMVADQFGISPERILTHPGAGPSATKSGKDPREASWKKQVLAYIDQNLGGFGGTHVASSGGSLSVDLTAYSPMRGGDKMQGGYAAARPGPDGKAEVRTLADVAAGRSDYVTIAGNPRDYGKTFTIPEIPFVDAKGQRKTLRNVTAVVHDTGRAFANAPEGRFDIPIDRDATERQRNASHKMWKDAGIRFVAAEQDQPPPVSERGLTQYAGVPKPSQVADASGRIGAPSGGQIAERVASRVDDNNRPTNTIPGQQTAQAKGLSPQEFEQQQKDAQARATPGEVRQERPQWASPSIRTHMLDKFNERAPMLAKAAQTQLRAYVERVEKSAGDGYLLPEQERALIHERMNRYGSDELKVRLKAAEQAAAATAQMKQLPPTVLSGQIAQLRSAMNQAGATPEIIAKAKAAEALHTKMVKELNENAIGWGAEAGVIGPQMPITPQTFSIDTLRQRAEAANVVAQHYGLEYRQFFTKEEKEALEAQFSTGGDNMLAMMGMMYEAFGDDLPRAVAEISPKYPEAARAGYLLSTGGDPKAAEAIAQSIERRQDPNYKGNIKLDKDANEIAKDVFGDYFRDMPQRERDATMRAAEAIYIANFRPDMGMDSEETFKSALKSAMGERTNAAGEVFGGVVNTKGGGAFFPSNKEAILLPSNVRQKTWRQLFDFISANDIVESGHPIPVDANGTPLRMPKVLGGRMVQVGDGKYMFELTNRDGSPAWVMEGQPPGAAKSDAAAQMRPSKPFVLDLKTLTPVLRRRWPDFFWKE